MKPRNMTVLQSTEGIARWRRIAESLSRDVSEARFPDGRLPTEPDLAARFGVNRHTIRRAIGELADQGLVRVEQGRGTFVATSHIDYLLGRRTRFSTNLQREGREPGHQLISTTRGVADAATTQDLGLDPGAPIIEIETLGRADGVPVNYAVHRFPAERFAALPEAFAATLSVTAALAACGVSDYTRHTTRLLARMPSQLEARYLEQPSSRPVLQAESVNVDLEGIPIQRSLTVFSGDRVQITVALDGESR
ncbi:MAG TPA: phosphonate metabolism transcriptional regulator PhnF [Stellaceae bacterium]|nr:phosphonate metabolism transcriptional regulator PhnF [Stellaceae bacterium]